MAWKTTPLWFSPRITVGVWIGRNLKAPIGPRMSGQRAALPVWKRFMEDYAETLDEAEQAEQLPVPAGVVFSAMSGRVVSKGMYGGFLRQLFY